MRRNHDLEELMSKNLRERMSADDHPNANPTGPRQLVRASVASTLCRAKNFFYLTDAPEDPIDDLSACAFEDGRILESSILEDYLRAREAMTGQPVWRKEQVPCQFQDAYAGTADLVLLDSHDRPVTVVDGKSANPQSFDIALKKGSPSEQYILQVSLYAVALGAEECVIVYRQKAGTRKGRTNAYGVFEFAPDRAAVNAALAQIATAQVHAEKGYDAPIRNYDQDDWQCQYCNYRTHCWKEVGE